MTLTRFVVALAVVVMGLGALLVGAQSPPVPQNTSTPRAIVRQAHDFLQSHLVEGERC
jgi:hypothetical protein